MDPDRLFNATEALVELVAQLRGPGGCPWDAAQTPDSIKLYLLEEAYEVLDAIEQSCPDDVCEELGDLLFHIFFLARLAEEKNEFDFADVEERIVDKMIRRHPHVFGGERIKTAEDVACNWARIKRKEKKLSTQGSGCPKSPPVSMPAVMFAHRLAGKISGEGKDPADDAAVWEDVVEHFEALKSAVGRRDRTVFGREAGTLLFCLVNLVRLWGFHAEDLLRTTSRTFMDRLENAKGSPPPGPGEKEDNETFEK